MTDPRTTTDKPKHPYHRTPKGLPSGRVLPAIYGIEQAIDRFEEERRLTRSDAIVGRLLCELLRADAGANGHRLGYVHPSHDFLTLRLNMPEITVRRAITKLESLKLFWHKPGGYDEDGNKASQYFPIQQEPIRTRTKTGDAKVSTGTEPASNKTPAPSSGDDVDEPERDETVTEIRTAFVEEYPEIVERLPGWVLAPEPQIRLFNAAVFSWGVHDGRVQGDQFPADSHGRIWRFIDDPTSAFPSIWEWCTPDGHWRKPVLVEDTSTG